MTGEIRKIRAYITRADVRMVQGAFLEFVLDGYPGQRFQLYFRPEGIGELLLKTDNHYGNFSGLAGRWTIVQGLQAGETFEACEVGTDADGFFEPLGTGESEWNRWQLAPPV